MSDDNYLYTLISPSTGEYHEKGSRFLASAFACADINTFTAKIDELKTAHPKARHYCYAYRFGERGLDYRANDDGEPSGTAGLPIYNQLQSFSLSDTAIIVIRYFGGTLLGASGLIRAYKTAAQNALNAATLTPIIPKIRFTAALPYADVHKLMHLTSQHNIQILNQNFDMQSRFLLEAERSRLPAITAAFTQAKIEITIE